MKKPLFNTVLAALFSAIICVATFIIQIPVPITGGYINLGDCFVLFVGVVLGPFYAFLSAGIGSALADIFFGYFTYAPATFIIKGVMALIISCLIKKAVNKYSVFNLILFGAICELVMVVGYFLYEAFVLGFSFAALAAVPGNLFQGICGLSANAILVILLNKNDRLKKLLFWRE